MLDCPVFTFQGYFGRSREIMAAYPYGGFCQYITAPAAALVRLPSNVKFEEGGGVGYLGTAYGAMKRINVGPGEVLLINGISGTLGLCAAHADVDRALATSSIATALWVAAVHSLAMLLSGLAIAWAVYRWLGLAFLRRAWINLDVVWAGSLVLAGGAGVLSAALPAATA